MGAWLTQKFQTIADAYRVHDPLFWKMGVEIVVKKEEKSESAAVRNANIRISVVMPTYNGEVYLRRQLDSILGQLTDKDELVISDDGSTDGTLALLQEYRESDSRICLLKGPEQGIKKNVEHLLKSARGRYIFLADQDDIWVDGKVKKVLRAFESQKAAVVIHDARVFAGENETGIQMESFFAFRNAGAGVVKNIIKNSYIGCCMAFRRELLSAILPIPAQIEMHDQWIGILGDYYMGKSYFLPDALLLYRRHGANNSAMEHYGLVRMARNRVVFLCFFLARILQNRQKKEKNSVKFKKNDS